MTNKPSEFEKFDQTMHDLMKVAHSEIKAKLEEEKKVKKQKKSKSSSASARA